MKLERKDIMISKSKYVQSNNCPKKLWFLFNKAKEARPLSLSEMKNIDEGNLIGDLARRYPEFDKGFMCDHVDKVKAQLITSENIKNENIKIFYEATFCGKNKIIQSDILVRLPNGKFNLIEVKSSSKVKKEHLIDVAFQKKVLEENGIFVEKCFVMHINSEYVKKTENIDLNNFFSLADVSLNIKEHFDAVENKVKENILTIGKSDPPIFKKGKHCTSPNLCPFSDKCGKVFDIDSIDNLSRLHKDKKDELIKLKVSKIYDIPEEFPLTERQTIQKNVSMNNKNFVNFSKIKSFVSDIKYPIYHLDFEATNSGLPKYVGMKPNQFLVYQVSIHKEYESGRIEHFEFLNTENKDPREDVFNFMKKNIDNCGTILVWSKTFEISRMREFSLLFPKESTLINSWIVRVIDLALPFQKTWIYKKEFKGSYSIKNILPAMVNGLSYEDLAVVSNGSESQSVYQKLIDGDYGENSSEEFIYIVKNLLSYCELDTKSMVYILREIRSIINISCTQG
jgi:uncharacterized protein YlaI